MKSNTHPRFWKLYYQLPGEAQVRASKAYRLWQQDPNMPGLQFKRVSQTRPVYSVRIGDYYRALGLWHGDTITRFWVGNHDEYERLLKEM